MAIIYIMIICRILKKDLKAHERQIKYLLYVIISMSIIAMILYELYVQNRIGWEYGIPYDDDTGWIFRAATALKEGMSIDKLYTLVLSSDYDIANRALSFGNLGQYIYCIWVSSFLYFPKLINIKVNLLAIYIVQILMAVDSGIILTDCLIKELYMKQRNVRYSWWFIFVAFIICPLIQFNSYKLLRETLFFYMVTHTVCSCMNHEKRKALIYFGISIVFRPLIIVLLLPIYIYYLYDEKMGNIVNILLFIIMSVGVTIVNKIARILGWTYNIGQASLNKMVHLFLFPNFINQLENFLNLNKNPSWNVILYFFQSIWNIIYGIVFVFGIIGMKKRKTGYYFWMILFINCLMIYTIPYSTNSMTVRYKAIYLIPMMYFVSGSMVRFWFGKRKSIIYYGRKK